MEAVRKALRPSLGWLSLFLPVALVLSVAHRAGAPWASPTVVFFAAALAIIPLAGWMGQATEQVAVHLGEGIGGLLNATFGNAAELIIGFMALLAARHNPAQRATFHAIVKASLTGSIIGNTLLVLGIALTAGGARYHLQRFNPTASRAGSTLLHLAAFALVIPGLFVYFVPGMSPAVEALSVELSILLLLVYALSLVFSLGTHRHLYLGGQTDEAEDGEEVPEGEPPWPLRRAVGVLLAATVGLAVLAELMVGTVEAAAQTMGWTDLFVGVIVVAIVGNAAEHSTAVMMAWRNRTDLTLSVTIGSSIQVALFVAPVLVLVSALMGAPMNLVFTVPEIVAVALAVVSVSQVAGDGESHWLEGVLLLTLYIMLGVLFYHLPAAAGGPLHHG